MTSSTAFSPDVYTQRRNFCLYSIANTLTENCDIVKVQILVDRQNASQQSYRLPESFFRQAGAQGFVGAIHREESIIMSPYNALQALLTAWMTRRDDDVYGFLADTHMLSPVLTLESFTDILSGADPLTGFILTPGITGENAETALFTCDLSFGTGEETYIAEKIPLRMFRQNDWWYMKADDFLELVNLEK